MHAPRREPFWPEESRWPQASDPAKRIALVRRYALVIPGLILILAVGATWLTDAGLVALWRDVPAVRLGVVGLPAWLAGGIGWLLVEAVGLWVGRNVTEGTGG